MYINRMLVAAPIALPQIAHAQEAEKAQEVEKAGPAESTEEEASGPFSISGELGFFSDYRYRGVSLTRKVPEVTAFVAVNHESGVYVSGWASNVDLVGDGARDVEIDLALGFTKDVGPLTFDGGALYYLYPGNSSFNYVEAYGSVGFPVGPATVKLGFAYAPTQSNLGDRDNSYGYISGNLPIKDTPYSLHASFGYEDGAFGNGKRDWLAGISYDLGSGFTTSLDYVDTARAFSTAGRATALFSVKKAF